MAMRSGAGSSAVVAAGAAVPAGSSPGVAAMGADSRPPHEPNPLQHAQAHDEKQKPPPPQVADSDSGDGDDGDDRSDMDGDDDVAGVRPGKRKRPISVSYVSWYSASSLLALPLSLSGLRPCPLLSLRSTGRLDFMLGPGPRRARHPRPFSSLF